MKNEIIPILIVDDENELLEIYREFFEINGFKVLTASSAIIGLEIYKHNLDIRLVIADSNLGTSSTGIDFLNALTSIYQKMPVFYLATGEIELAEEYIKSLGEHGLVLKPFDLDEILIRIKKDLKL